MYLELRSFPSDIHFQSSSDDHLIKPFFCGGMVTSWLVCSPLDEVVQVRSLARDVVLWFWVRHLTLTVPLSTQVCKWVLANLMLGDNPAVD